MASGKGRTPRDSLTDEGPWQVALAPDDVKVVSLDRLDDLYRLGIIDESTRIRGPGMTDWQPLGLAAGIGSEPAREPLEPPVIPVPDVPAPRARATGRWIVVSAFVAGAIVASYRNDVARQGARAVGLERAFLRVEQALGGPGFGTPRAVQRLTER
jgi:hypothetical protein